MTSPVPVSEASRKAASDYLRAVSFDRKSEKFHAEMLAGKRDVSLTVQAFEQFRLAALDEAAEAAFKGSAKLASDNDFVRGYACGRTDAGTAILALKETLDAK